MSRSWSLRVLFSLLLFFSSFPTSVMDINIKYASECLVIYIAGSGSLSSSLSPSLSVCLARSLILKNASHCAVYTMCALIDRGCHFFLHSNPG